MTSDPPSRACDDVPPPEAEDLNQGFGVERDRHARATPIPLTRSRCAFDHRFLDGVGKGVDAHARSESGHASRRRRFRALRDRAHLTDSAQSDRLMTVRRRHGLWL